MKHVNFKERKKAVKIVSKRSAVIPTLQKDPPLSHKGVDIWKKLVHCLMLLSGRVVSIAIATLPVMASRLGWGSWLNPRLKCREQPGKIRDGSLESGRIGITPRQPRSCGEDTLTGLKSDELRVRS